MVAFDDATSQDRMPTRVFPEATAGTPIPSARGGMLMLINDFDWASTPVGPMASWPSAFSVTVRVMLASHVPMVMLMGADGVMVYNDAYSVFAGKRHPQLLGSKVLEGWREIADFNRHVMDVCMRGETLSFEGQRLTLHRNDRPEEVWMDLDYSPVLGEDGEPLGVLAIVYDTTKRFETERALHRSEERLSLALAASGTVGIWDWDIAANLVTADERFATMFGVDPQKAASGLPIEDFEEGIHPEDRDYVRDRIEESLSGRAEYQAEYRLGKDGSVRWVIATGRVIRAHDGTPARLPGIVVDITQRKASEAALTASEAKFRAIADTLPQMVWSTLPDGFHDYFNARWYEFTDAPQGSTDGEGWNAMFHPEDRERARAAWNRSLRTGETYEIEYRLRHRSGDYRWTLGRALPVRDDKGRIIRWFGTCTDIHETKQAAEEREIVAQELSHRIKNLFSVLTGIIGLSARTYPEVKPFADQLRQRIQAMGQAHDFVRPHSTASRPPDNPSSLKSLVAQLLSPFRDQEGTRIAFEGPDAIIDDAAATPIALLFHELATNSAKYGALASQEGRILVETANDGERYRMVWRELDGAHPVETPQREGFGSRLIQLSVEGQLAGRLERRWLSDGLEVDVDVPLASLSRSARLKRRPARN